MLSLEMSDSLILNYGTLTSSHSWRIRLHPGADQIGHQSEAKDIGYEWLPYSTVSSLYTTSKCHQEEELINYKDKVRKVYKTLDELHSNVQPQGIRNLEL